MKVKTTESELWLKAKDFANELTSHNVIEKDLTKENQISQEHVDNNKAVRNMLLQRGVKPKALPPAEDVRNWKDGWKAMKRKLQRVLNSTDSCLSPLEKQ